MDRRNLKWITWCFLAITVLTVALMLAGTLRRTTHITLPETGSMSGQMEETPGVSGDALTVVDVTPETVQAAIETLARPQYYRRTVTVEQFWDGGSGTYETAVQVHAPWTRTDRVMPDGRVRRTIVGTEDAYIWYDNESSAYHTSAESVSADQEQAIPTYEDVLALPVESIVVADFRTVSDVECIYVETEETAGGYIMRYWVSVDTGLLVVAEKLLDGEPTYRMASLSVDLTEPTVWDFTLPDGTVLFEDQ